ncbi:N-6 DNA methylase [Pseudorhodoferax sp. Leaf274]|uniref:N-6 DNA methylase n=1 Tax=Pseudorhodoferax sp. Leaf274 TaxID=1736318 RepID=UPI000702879D|nr:N-6 DNA methylase [Pseudorhodoferax sp. Leaf274]KQP37965.1 hypothetical protein ASF44_12140 [Pseudorhodoferax sp. Leaf274]
MAHKKSERYSSLTDLGAIFQSKALDFSKTRFNGDDILGDASKYPMQHFATESGKSKGQFYTPAEVRRVIAQVRGIGTATTTPDTTVHDPACGSGSLLLKVADAAQGTGVDLLDALWQRFEAFGMPPAKQGDDADLLHIVRSPKSTSRDACTLFPA